jgi:hypothetical protein
MENSLLELHSDYLISSFTQTTATGLFWHNLSS